MVSEEKSKIPQPIRGRGGLSCNGIQRIPFRGVVPLIGPKNTNVVEDVEILLPVNFAEFHSSVSEEKSRMSQPIRSLSGHLYFQSAIKTQPWWRTFKSCFLSSFVEFQLAVTEEKSKMSQLVRGQGGHLVFPIGPKTTNLVEDVEILLPFEFR